MQSNYLNVRSSNAESKISRRLLIPRSQRRRFVIQFTLMTALSLFVARWLSKALLDLPFLTLNQPVESFKYNYLLLRLIEAAITGNSLGLFQAIALRNYIPSKPWFFATSCGWTLAWFIPLAWLEITLNTPHSWFLLHQLAVSIICYICFGGLQRFALRGLVTKANRWVFVPLVSLIIAALLITPLIIAIARGIQIPANFQLLIQTIPFALSFGTFQAIIFSTLSQKTPKKEANLISTSDSILFSAPEITDLRVVKALSNQLYYQIDEARSKENFSSEELKYLVAVNEDGAIVAYQALNQAAVDYVHQTPLPKLVDVASANAISAESRQSIAKFHIIFTASGGIKIKLTMR